MQRATVLFVAASILMVGVIGGVAFWVTTQPTPPTRLERTMACIDRLGYSAYTSHDDGKESESMPEFGLAGDVQVRPPSDHVIVKIPGGKVEDMTISDDSVHPEIIDHGDPPKAAERAAIAACANR
jgi:hypothetical protein